MMYVDVVGRMYPIFTCIIHCLRVSDLTDKHLMNELWLMFVSKKIHADRVVQSLSIQCSKPVMAMPSLSRR